MDYKEKVIALLKSQELSKEQKEKLENIFPELKESDDEKIRKALVEMVHDTTGDSLWIDYNVHKEDAIVWLEKQDEQKPQGKSALEAAKEVRVDNQNCVKPADKVKPKFKVGDWIQIERGHVMKILDVDEEIPCYVILNWYGGQSVRSISDIDSISHLWTIQDAKDSDVLAFNDGHGNDCIELIKSITEKKIEFWFCLTNGNYYEVFDGITPYTNFTSREDATPATKEQRDLLFQKMKEAGYEWNAEKKELNKIEPKQEWSEEDENHVNSLLKRLEGLCRKEFAMTRFAINEDEDWLKSIKDRVQPQLLPQQEWSEEDEEILRVVVDYLIADNGLTLKHINWLKSLRPRSHWKPSDEQMDALETAVCSLQSTALESLYQDLKRL